MPRNVKTVVRSTNSTFGSLPLGQPYIRPYPSDPNSPCVYFKVTENLSMHQTGEKFFEERSTTAVIPVRIIETHIVKIWK